MKPSQPRLGASGRRWLVYHVAAWWTLVVAIVGIWLYNTEGAATNPTGWRPLPIDHYVAIFVITVVPLVYTGSRWRHAAHTAHTAPR